MQLPEGLKLRVPRAGPRFSPVAPLPGSPLSSTRLLCDSENKPTELLITAVLAPAVRCLIPHLAGSDLPSWLSRVAFAPVSDVGALVSLHLQRFAGPHSCSCCSVEAPSSRVPHTLAGRPGGRDRPAGLCAPPRCTGPGTPASAEGCVGGGGGAWQPRSDLPGVL